MWIQLGDRKLLKAISFKIKSDATKHAVMAYTECTSAEFIFISYDYAECVEFISSIADSINRGIKIMYIAKV
jgi:hypothetical protein